VVCHPGPPLIRTCPIKASGSSRCGFAVPRTTHPLCGDTLGGSMPSAWFRRLVHNAAPPSLHGVWEGPFPRFLATTRRSDSLPLLSPHFVAFVWRYRRFVPGSSPPARDRAGDQPGVGQPGLQPAVTTETAGPLRFPSSPHVPAPCSWTPVGPKHARPLRRVGAAPACVNNGGSRDEKDFGARSHGIGTHCLRFAGRVTPPPRKTRFRMLAKLFRAGFVTRRVA
jgi:hypothetical protein